VGVEAETDHLGLVAGEDVDDVEGEEIEHD
jgi:hypothetical protein